MPTNRTIHAYAPMGDLSLRHPLWRVHASSLHGIGEVFDVPRRTVLIDPGTRGKQYAVAHALAHLDLGHVKSCGGGAFSEQQERDAHWLAQLRVDSEADRERA